MSKCKFQSWEYLNSLYVMDMTGDIENRITDLKMLYWKFLDLKIWGRPWTSF